MIAYFDTSAVVPLIIEEPSTVWCLRIWNTASRVVSSRLVYPEARAALARAQRMGRMSTSQLASAVDELESIALGIDYIEVNEQLSRAAGHLAQEYGLRGYDAVHLAAASAAADTDLVLVTGDASLGEAAAAMGIAVSVPS